MYASPPVQGIVACVRVGGGGFELHKQSANEIRLLEFPEILPGTGNFFGTQENRVPLTSLNESVHDGLFPVIVIEKTSLINVIKIGI